MMTFLDTGDIIDGSLWDEYIDLIIEEPLQNVGDDVFELVKNVIPPEFFSEVWIQVEHDCFYFCKNYPGR